MGVAVSDFDEDGHFDIAKTNFSDDTPNLYRNNRDGTFSDRVYAAGLGARTQYLGWGIHFLDVDHDGRKELLIVNGHVYPEVDQSALPVRYRQPRLSTGTLAMENTRTSPPLPGRVSQRRVVARSAQGDLDNDGWLEIVIDNMALGPAC